MKKSINDKIDDLKNSFRPMDKVLLAYSGGVDSSYLLYLLNMANLDQLTAITIKTPYIPEWEVDEAVEFCRELGINHEILTLGISDSIINNPPERCYLCKKLLFSKIRDYANTNGFNIIADGTNFDDTGDYRPGLKALKELEIRSPLLESGFSKDEIRSSSKTFGLKSWDKPAYACLLTRIPHNVKVSPETLRKIEIAEKFLHVAGFSGLRMRMHGDVARLECKPSYFIDIIDKRDEIVSYLKSLGIKYITIDIEGYRTGSMNPE